MVVCVRVQNVQSRSQDRLSHQKEIVSHCESDFASDLYITQYPVIVLIA